MSKTLDRRAARLHAGTAAAMSDYRQGGFHMPRASDDPDWARGYREAVQQLADTLGREKIKAMQGTLEG